jgi:hypothetical protein
VYPPIERLLKLKNVPIRKLPFDETLELLSPHQFETLFFLTLTNEGIFSPAWRAGSLPDIDITGTNYSSNKPVLLGPNWRKIKFPLGDELKFQLKRKRRQNHYKNANFTDAISSKRPNERVLTADWLFSVIKDQEKTKQWLEYSLQWYLADTDYKSIMDIILE